MLKFSAYILTILIIFISCGKNDSSGCQPAAVDSEKPQMVAFCTANGINYTENASGMLFEIINAGTGTMAPTTSSTVTVQYVGKFFNGTIFDSSTTAFSSVLSSLIDGWKLGIPLIKKGGRIKMVIPSALAYSCTGYPPKIAPNTPLYFDVTLMDVK